MVGLGIHYTFVVNLVSIRKGEEKAFETDEYNKMAELTVKWGRAFAVLVPKILRFALTLDRDGMRT